MVLEHCLQTNWWVLRRKYVCAFGGGGPPFWYFSTYSGQCLMIERSFHNVSTVRFLQCSTLAQYSWFASQDRGLQILRESDKIDWKLVVTGSVCGLQVVSTTFINPRQISCAQVHILTHDHWFSLTGQTSSTTSQTMLCLMWNSEHNLQCMQLFNCITMFSISLGIMVQIWAAPKDGEPSTSYGFKFWNCTWCRLAICLPLDLGEGNVRKHLHRQMHAQAHAFLWVWSKEFQYFSSRRTLLLHKNVLPSKQHFLCWWARRGCLGAARRPWYAMQERGSCLHGWLRIIQGAWQLTLKHE